MRTVLFGVLATHLPWCLPPLVLLPKSLISVAVGTVQFDNSGLATVKIANLNIKHKTINKGQRIAIAEYLPSSLF
ncbi:hypothetical protein G6F26_014115 [Rhizopus arrhizus]|uniref:Uncharacterized protein n=1 Tax=Rhizopus oryzae TaxID=64495 RepID=A0A9P7BJS2_RHIOR|nr:hypothetical protein G6F30_014185 [Rhizopus arrhizus]KAG0993420.1 hypothetical protein G6F27_014131 [Rhizopus arrhizus]KAG1003428.1 hypothetical protein G6F26_014115 [Rhizopus arrhizus]KAG1058246.1 hypothetical protein G6F41_014064 [Rhizopus arrhizus]KAG1080586.1 hypothetical protein G6F39_014084 [Rhizopus arrhizus]